MENSRIHIIDFKMGTLLTSVRVTCILLNSSLFDRIVLVVIEVFFYFVLRKVWKIQNVLIPASNQGLSVLKNFRGYFQYFVRQRTEPSRKGEIKVFRRSRFSFDWFSTWDKMMSKFMTYLYFFYLSLRTFS